MALIAAIFSGVMLMAQVNADSVVRLYPQGQDSDKGIVEKGVEITLGPGESNGLTGPEEGKEGRFMKNINDNARIAIYLPTRAKTGQMVVICPGGGYAGISTGSEGSWVAEWLLNHGVAACVVFYRMPNGHDTVPLRDVQNAFRYCRAHSEEWGIDQIGVMGFSAGGHLAATASTMFVDEVTRPDFSILVYPVITMEEGVTHAGTMRNLTAEDPARIEKYSIENRVTKDTPPAILLLSADDDAVAPENSLRYYRKLEENGIRRELRIFPHGGHGWGFTTAKYAADGIDKLDDDYRAEFFNTVDNYLYKISLTR